jgi:predicted metal-dependent hydrolase
MLNDYEIKRSSRRTLALEMKSDGSLLVRAPYRTTEAAIRRFLEESTGWIEKHRRLAQKRLEEQKNHPCPAVTPDLTVRLRSLAAKTIPPRVALYAGLLHVTYGKITIRTQKTRWGSCSAAGNLNFNALLMLTPPDVQDYVIIHELCHRKQMNHSPAFWREVEHIMPDYRERRNWLKKNGGALIRSMIHEKGE